MHFLNKQVNKKIFKKRIFYKNGGFVRGEKGKKNPRTYKNVAEDKKAPAPYGAHIVNKICRMLGFFYLKFVIKKDDFRII